MRWEIGLSLCSFLFWGDQNGYCFSAGRMSVCWVCFALVFLPGWITVCMFCSWSFYLVLGFCLYFDDGLQHVLPGERQRETNGGGGGGGGGCLIFYTGNNSIGRKGAALSWGFGLMGPGQCQRVGAATWKLDRSRFLETVVVVVADTQIRIYLVGSSSSPSVRIPILTKRT